MDKWCCLNPKWKLLKRVNSTRADPNWKLGELENSCWVSVIELNSAVKMICYRCLGLAGFVASKIVIVPMRQAKASA